MPGKSNDAFRRSQGAKAKTSGISIKPSHKGLLHRDLGVPQGQAIPAVRKRATFAANAKSWNK
jgi:hypothetical protein